MNVYLDLNIFDRIEKQAKLERAEQKIYHQIENLILTNRIAVPYSNAHLNDLFRGYQKNPTFISGHLETIKRLTKDLCLCQYWNRSSATWHFRDINEFFNEKITEWEFEPKSFLDLMTFDDIDIPNPLEVSFITSSKRI
jgi:hypothetical protein